MGLLEKGTDWFNAKSEREVEPVNVVSSSGSLALTAIVIEPETTVNGEGVRVHHDHYTFLFTKSLFTDTRRGVQIYRVKRNNEKYEVVAVGTTTNDTNDPFNQKIAVFAKLCS